MNRIKKGDTVEVLSGNYRGERGTVRSVLTKKGRVVVDGINIVKRHQRPTGRVRTQAGIIEFEAPMGLNKVALVCPNCGERSRVGFRIGEVGGKVRVCKKCGEDID